MYNNSLVKKLAQSVKLFCGLASDDIREFLANCGATTSSRERR